jgi:hypothetical protein
MSAFAQIEVDSLGNVGIGTTNNDGYKLAVGGTAKANSFDVIKANYNSSLTGNRLIFDRPSLSYIDNINTSGSLAFRTGGVNDIDMHITSDGNVGINKTTPSRTLDVYGSYRNIGVGSLDREQWNGSYK